MPINLTLTNKQLDLSAGLDPVKTAEANAYELSSRADALSLDIGTKDTETKRQDTFGETTAIQEAKSVVLGKLSPQQVAEKAISEGKSIDDIVQEYNDMYAKTEKVALAKDYYKILGNATSDPEINAAGASLAANLGIARDMISAEMAKIENGLGLVGKTGHFLDKFLVRQIVVGTFEDLTFRSERMGMSLLGAAATLGQEEYKAFINDYIAGLKDEGFFTSDNIFALSAGLDAATNAGYDPEAAQTALLALVFDVGGAAAPFLKAGKAAKLIKLAKADTAVAIEVVTVGGDSAATKVGKAILEGDAPAQIIEEANPKVLNLDEVSKLRDANGVPNIDFNANTGLTKKILEENKTLRAVADILQSGAAGRVTDGAIVVRKLEEIAKAFDKSYANPVINYAVSTDAMDNKVAHVWFGNKKDGSVFAQSSKRHAEAAAKEIEGATVVPAMKDGKEGWVIHVAQRMDLSQGQLLDVSPVFNNTVKDIISKYLASAALRDNQRLSVLAQMGEGVSSVFKELAMPLVMKIQKLSKSDKGILGTILDNLRDDPNKSFLREWHTDAEFIAEYKALRTDGAAPSEKTMEAWKAIVDLSDANYIMKANEILQRYVTKGYRKVSLSDDIEMAATKVDKIPDGETYVWDVKHQYMAKVGKETESAKSIYKLDKPFTAANGSTATHAIDPSKVGILEYHDVLGYNAGGHRQNKFANYFIVLANKAGEVMRPKAMMSAFSAKEVKKGVEELKVLALAKREGRLTDELVSAHNGWDPKVTTVDEFDKVVADSGWDLERTITYKERNQALVEDATHPMFGSTAEDYIKTDMKRMDEVLKEYGGGYNYNVNALNSIVESYGNSATTLANRAWSVNALNSWVKTARANPDLVRIPAGLEDDIHGVFREAQIIGKSPGAQRLKELRNITNRRLGRKDEIGKAMEDFGQSMAEYVYDTTKIKLGKLDPANKLLTLGFHSAFGFYNVSQFFMQGFSAVTIMAMAPKHGVRGLGLTVPMRLVLNAGDAAAEKLAIKRMAAASAMSEEDITELARYIRTSGRGIIDGDVAELGTGVGHGLQSDLGYYTKKAADGGLIFFKQGERLSRLTGINTAFLEFKEAYPTMSALSDYGRSWIARREQALSLNMTTTSKSAMQTGPGGLLKVPTQWLSYSFRVMEAITFGTGGLKPAERARLFLTLGPMFGASGFGFANAADYAAEALGISPDSDANVLLRFGVIDWAIGQATGVDTALATRLAPADQFVDLYSKIFGDDKSFREVTLGPSGAIMGSLVDAGMNVISDAFHMRPVSLSADVITLMKQPSGLSNVAKAYGIWNNGLYQSKTGTYFPGKFTPADAIMQALGFTPQEVIELQQRRTQVYNGNKEFMTFSRYVNKKSEAAYMMILEGNDDDKIRGLMMMKEINTEIKLSGFSPMERKNLASTVWRKDGDAAHKTINALLVSDKTFAARRLRSVMEGLK